MLKLTIMEIILRAIPEAFLYMLGIYTFTKKRIKLKNYIVSSILGGGFIGVVRALPISYGIHTILLMIVFAVLSILINKTDTIKSVQATILVIIAMFICEAINVLLIYGLFSKDIEHIFTDPVIKIIYGIPSLLILGTCLGWYYRRLSKRKELQDV